MKKRLAASLAVCSVAALTGCTQPKVPALTQALPIVSGDAGLIESAEVVSIDFIRFDATFARYDDALSQLAREWLNSRSSNITQFLDAFVGEAARQLAGEVEETIRSRNCIYAVRPAGSVITNLVSADLEYSAVSVEEEILDLATDAELDYLDSLPDPQFDAEYDRLIAKYTPMDTPEITNTSGLVAVASQCQMTLKVGDPVTLVKFKDYVSISPVLSETSFANR